MNQWTVSDISVESQPDLKSPDLLHKSLGKPVMAGRVQCVTQLRRIQTRNLHSPLDVYAIGAHACLTRATEFAGNRPFYRRVEVGAVIEHDQGGVSSELERDLIHSACSLLHEKPSDIRRTCKRDLLDSGIRCKNLADLCRILERGNKVDYAFGDPGSSR